MLKLKVRTGRMPKAQPMEVDGASKIGEAAERFAEGQALATPNGATFFLDGRRLDPEARFDDAVPNRSTLDLWIS